MPGMYELERIVVRLIGDGSSYRRMLNQAAADTEKMTRVVSAHANRVQAITDKNNVKLLQMQQAHQARIASMIASGAPAQAIQRAHQVHQMRVQHIQQNAYLRAQQMAAVHATRLAQLTEEGSREAADAMRRNMDRMSTYATVAFAVIGSLALVAFAKFDQVMTKAEAVFKATARSAGGEGLAEGINEIRGAALQLSGRVIQSPRELGEAYFFLAQAGFSAKQSMEVLPIISEFATAGSISMDKAADSLVGIQKAMAMTVEGDPVRNAQQLQRIADVITVGSTQSLATVEQLVDALVNHAAPSLRAIGKDVEEGTALLAAYGDQLRRGKVAGADLSRVIRLLGAPESTAKAKAGREKWGLKVFDDQGRMKKFSEIAKNLEDILGPLAPQLRLVALEEMGFEARIQHAVLPMIEMSKTIADYEKRMDEARGTTKAMAADISGSFSNQMAIFRNQILDLAIAIGKDLAPSVLAITEKFRGLGDWWRGLDSGWKQLIGTLGLTLAMIAPITLLIRTILMLGSAIKATFMLTPWTAGIMLGIVAIVALTESIKNASDEVKELNDALDQVEKTGSKIEKFRADRFEKMVFKPGGEIKDPIARKAFYTQELDKANKQLQGFIDNVERLKREVEKVKPFWIERELGMSLPDTTKHEWELEKKNLKEAEKALENHRNAIERIRKEIEAAANAPKDEAKRQVDELADAIQKLRDKFKEEAATIGMSSNEMEIYRLRVQQAKVMSEGFNNTIELQQMLMKEAQILALERSVKAIEEGRKMFESEKKVKEGADKLVESLKEKIATFEMTSEQADIYKLKMEAAEFALEPLIAAQLKEAEALAEQVRSMEAVKKTLERIKHLTEQYQAPIITLQQKQAELTGLFISGALSIDIYANAMADVARETMKIDQAHKSLNNTFQATTVGSAEAATRMQQYLDVVRGDKIRNDPIKAIKQINRAGQGLWPGNRLQPPNRPPGGWGMGEAPAGGFPGMKGRQRGEPRILWETVNTPLNESNKILADIRTLLQEANDRPTVEIEAAGLT